MRPLYRGVRPLVSRLVILIGSFTFIALGFRLSHGHSTLESFAGAFLVVSGAQIALWSLGIRLEMLANTAAEVSKVSMLGVATVADEPDIDRLLHSITDRFQFLEKKIEHQAEESKTVIERRLQLLDGRAMAISGYVMAEASREPGNPMEPSNKDRLERAVSLLQESYDLLGKVGGPAEMMALNNLVYYSAILNDRARSDFLLSKARLLFQVGQERDSVNLLLTACMAILHFGDDLDEKKRAREVLRAIERRSRTTNIEQREASFYLEYFSARQEGTANKAPNPGGPADG